MLTVLSIRMSLEHVGTAATWLKSAYIELQKNGGSGVAQGKIKTCWNICYLSSNTIFSTKSDVYYMTSIKYALPIIKLF